MSQHSYTTGQIFNSQTLLTVIKLFTVSTTDNRLSTLGYLLLLTEKINVTIQCLKGLDNKYLGYFRSPKNSSLNKLTP